MAPRFLSYGAMFSEAIGQTDEGCDLDFLQNARAALNFLDKSPPDVAEVREALTCIVNDADRASDVVDRIGSLIKKRHSGTRSSISMR